MKVTQLKDHQLLKLASELSREYILKCDPVNSESDPYATKKQSYGIEVFLSVGNIISCIDQLYFCIDLLSGYRANSTPEKMNRYDYIVFGIENYYLRLTSVFDRSLRLANVIFQIGLPERECNNSTIVKNSHIKGTQVGAALKELDKFTGPFRFHRNTVAHQGTYSERDLDWLGSMYYLVEEDGDLKNYKYSVKSQTDNYIMSKKDEFKESITNIEGLVNVYFDALLVSFESKLRAFV